MALASPYPDVEIPNKSVPEAVLDAGREHSARGQPPGDGRHAGCETGATPASRRNPVALASPYPDVEIPNKSVPEAVLAAGRERPDAPALIDGLKGDVITHGQLAQYVDRVAANLHARGLRKGDVVAVFCPTTGNHGVFGQKKATTSPLRRPRACRFAATRST